MTTDSANNKPEQETLEGAQAESSEAEIQAAASGNGEDETLDLEQALEDARNEVARHQDAMLRLQAEMENQRKRLARELEKAHKFALDKFMNALLPVRDSLERGLEAAAEADVEALKEGKALTLKMLTKVMQDFGLEIIDPLGEPFDPEWHEAVSMQASGEAEANTVTTVIQKGFKLNNRLIRPAMVIVAAG